MGTILSVIFAVVFTTILGSIILAAIHDILKWWFNEAMINSSIHIGEWTKKKVYIIIGISLWVSLTLLFVGMK